MISSSKHERVDKRALRFARSNCWVPWRQKGIKKGRANYRGGETKALRGYDSPGDGVIRDPDRDRDPSRCDTNPGHNPLTIEDKKRKRRTVVLVEDEEAVVKNLALAISILSCLPSSAIAQSGCANIRQLTICERDLLDAGLRWEGRAREVKEKLRGCTSKLKVRTATLADALFVSPPRTANPVLDKVLLSIAGLCFGMVIGIILSE